MAEHDGLDVLVFTYEEVIRRGLSDLISSVSFVKQVFTPEWDSRVMEVVAEVDEAVVVLTSCLTPAPSEELLTELRRRGPIIGILSSSDPTSVSVALSWKANSYVTMRELTEQALQELFTTTLRAGAVISNEATDLFLRKSTSVARLVHLTPRETDVVKLLAEGLPNKGIARELDISTHSTKRYVSNLLTKLHCSNRAQAVSRALDLGIA
jgi:DNA-binding NarL/FixJ family response regulator